MGGSPGEISEDPVTKQKQKKDWRTNYNEGEATEWLEI